VLDRAVPTAYDLTMGKVYDAIEPPLAEFIARQRVFFVATAPLAADGHVNVSPKGLDAFAVLDPRTVAYLDLTGSGVETIPTYGRTSASPSASAPSTARRRSSGCTDGVR